MYSETKIKDYICNKVSDFLWKEYEYSISEVKWDINWYMRRYEGVFGCMKRHTPGIFRFAIDFSMDSVGSEKYLDTLIREKVEDAFKKESTVRWVDSSVEDGMSRCMVQSNVSPSYSLVYDGKPLTVKDPLIEDVNKNEEKGEELCLCSRHLWKR